MAEGFGLLHVSQTSRELWTQSLEGTQEKHQLLLSYAGFQNYILLVRIERWVNSAVWILQGRCSGPGIWVWAYLICDPQVKDVLARLYLSPLPVPQPVDQRFPYFLVAAFLSGKNQHLPIYFFLVNKQTPFITTAAATWTFPAIPEVYCPIWECCTPHSCISFLLPDFPEQQSTGQEGDSQYLVRR